jgi:LacI family transcriptional regulator
MTNDKSQQRVTMIDVAKHAGVSFKTVSRVLNGESPVRDETRRVVLEAAKELDYQLNIAARNLRVGGSRIIALLVNNPSLSYAESVHLGALQQCQKAGAHLIIEDCGADLSSIEKMINDTSPMGVVVTPPLCENPDLIAMLDARNIRYVLIAPKDPNLAVASVNINDEAAAEEMTNHLLALGHTRIGFIKGHPEHSVTFARLDGFNRALTAAGLSINPELLEQGQFDWSSGLECAERLLDLPNPPSAIFASNDDMAAAVIAAAYRRNIHVPRDLSVVGFDNTQIAAVISPQLTTVNQPIAELASAAVDLLSDQTYQAGDRRKPVFLDYQIVKRQSAGPLIGDVNGSAQKR